MLPAEEPDLRRRRPTAWLGPYAAEAVLPLYILHQPVLVALAFYVVRWPLHPVVKYAVISLATLVVCLAAYELIRRTAPTRFLFGMRPAGAPAASGRGDRKAPDPVAEGR